MWRAVAALTVALVVAGGATACSEDRAETGATTTTAPRADGCGPDDLAACAAASSLADYVPDEPTEATGEPIVLGMINQENTPGGSYPELSQAARAAADYVNAELGGIDGRPIEIDVCNTGFSPEGSTSCAQGFVTDGVPAVLGGIDVFGNGIDTLAENGVPFVGGIPISTQSVTSPNSYQWSGGTWGAAVAFADHAVRVGKAEKVAIVYGDFGSVADGARYGQATLEDAGVDVAMVPYPITAADLTSPMQAAIDGDPDAIFVLAADAGCSGAFDAVDSLAVDATMYYVGACAATRIVDDAGDDVVEGGIFNTEGLIDRANPDPDTTLYSEVVAAYGDEDLDAIGAGTVSFRSFMNLYRVLRDLGADGITPEAVSAALEDLEDAPSFMGHPATCDHEQLAGLPALCAPQQVLGEMRDGDLVQVGTWVDVGAIYPG